MTGCDQNSIKLWEVMQCFNIDHTYNLIYPALSVLTTVVWETAHLVPQCGQGQHGCASRKAQVASALRGILHGERVNRPDPQTPPPSAHTHTQTVGLSGLWMKERSTSTPVLPLPNSKISICLFVVVEKLSPSLCLTQKVKEKKTCELSVKISHDFT